MINKVNAGSNLPIEMSKAGSAKYPVNDKSANVSNVSTGQGALTGAIQHMVKQGMPIDLQRVVAVRNAIADGQYPVNPLKIAEKIAEYDLPTRNVK